VRVGPEMEETLEESKELEGRMSKPAEEKMGAGECKLRHQKPRPQICVVSKVTVFQER
jgi:hypothetical protein